MSKVGEAEKNTGTGNVDTINSTRNVGTVSLMLFSVRYSLDGWLKIRKNRKKDFFVVLRDLAFFFASFFKKGATMMSPKYQNRIEIRGLDDSDIDYLKTLANQQKAKSFNQFLVNLCREKIRHGNFNRAEHLYVVPLKQMAESDHFLVQQTAQQNKDLEELTAQMENFSHHIARWLKYEGMEDIDE